MAAFRSIYRYLWVLAAGALAFAYVGPASAHVKWFSDFSFIDQPLTFMEVVTNPIYIGLVMASMVVMGGLVVVDKQLDGMTWYQRVNTLLSDQQEYSLTVMRIAMAAVMIISWSSDAVLTPELATGNVWVGWLEFIVAVLLLFPRTTPLGGAGLLFIYLVSIYEFGLIYMLDYLHFAGISFYLMVSQSTNERLKQLGLPALYATVGFSLIWLGYEKLFYPEWALYLLEQNPQLALGLPTAFFLRGAAFVEIALGYLLIIGLLERPLAAIITLVFFSTTMIFGKLEVIGHLPIHAALVIFLFNGTGTIYKPPIAIHRNLNWRVAFAAVNFALIALVFAGGYSLAAWQQYETALAEAENAMAHGGLVTDISDAENPPRITEIDVVAESPQAYNLHVQVENWAFVPTVAAENPDSINEGHAHVYVDGEQVGRMYGEWFYLGDLDPGSHQIVVTLNGNNHAEFVVDGQIVGAETSVTVDP